MYNCKRVMVVVMTTVLLLCGVPSVSAQDAVEVSSSASSAVLYEPSSGRVLFEQQAHIKRPMASTTKLMTALLVTECIPPNAVLTATWDAVNVEGSSMGLQVGDTITRDDLLYGLLLSSGNDAANVAALSIDGSYEAFAERMNMRAAQLGMHNSYFVTPSGLDGEGHGASAYDMALLAAQVLRHDLLAAICACKQATVTIGDRTVHLTNHNRLLSEYDGAIGMKTGYTSKAGRCLVSAAKRDGVTLIAVTLDCANDWEEHKALLDAGFARMQAVTLCPAVPSELPVFGGEQPTVAMCADAVTVTLLQEDAQAVTYEVSLPAYAWAPVREGEVLGSVSCMLRGACVATIPIIAAQTAEAMPPSSWRLRFHQVFTRLLRQALI